MASGTTYEEDITSPTYSSLQACLHYETSETGDAVKASWYGGVWANYTWEFNYMYHSLGYKKGSNSEYSKANSSGHSVSHSGSSGTHYHSNGTVSETFAKTTSAYNVYLYSYCRVDSLNGSYWDSQAEYHFTVPALATYTIKYNANGGSGAPGNQTKTYGVNLTLSSTIPTKAGYKFLGWSTSSTATSATYAAGGTYSSNSGTTLYAVWAVAKVTVYYNAGTNGIVTSVTPSTASATQYRKGTDGLIESRKTTNTGSTWTAWADSYSTVLSTATHANLTDVSTFKLTRTGYHVVGASAWNTKEDGSGYSFSQDDTESNPTYPVTTKRLNGNTEITKDINQTLYPRWVINTYTVSYNANGGTANTTPTAQTKTHGVTLTLSSTKPTKANVTSNVTVTFNPNGGSATPTSATSVKSVPQTFATWNTKSDGSGTTATPGRGFSVNGSSHGATITLYAQWTSGTAAYSSVTLANGTRANHTLLGWYTVSATTCGTKCGNAGDNYTPAGNETVYARWGYNVAYNENGGSATLATQVKTPGTPLTLRAAITRNKITDTHTIGFNPNGGSVSPTSTTATKTISYTFANWKATDNTTYAASGSYTKDEPTTMTAQWTSTTTTAAVTLPTPTWTGRIVDGWYTDTSWTTKRGNAGANYTPTQSETLYARWKRSITYNKNTTATVTNLPSTQTAYTDTDIQISNTTPSWTNHSFYKWNTAADGSGTWYNPGQLYSDTNSLDLYAIWKYTITYNANGGTTAPAAHTGTVGQNIKIADEPIYEGYKFTAWTTNADGTGTVYDRGQIYTGQQNLTLYAKWTKINTVEDIQATDVSGGNRFVPASLISNIWNKIAPYFYGKTLYEFNGTIDWNTIRTTPTSNDLNITLSEACYNYKRLVVIGRTYHNTYVSTVILNPQRNKQFNLNDNFAYHNLTAQEPFSLYMRQVPWTISSDGTKIEQQGIYGQRYLRESTQTAGWNNNFNIKIIKVIGYKN